MRRALQADAQAGQVVDCGTIDDAADAERWVKARAAREKVRSTRGGRLLVERAGTDIVRLRAGLERVILYAWGSHRHRRRRAAVGRRRSRGSGEFRDRERHRPGGRGVRRSRARPGARCRSRPVHAHGADSLGRREAPLIAAPSAIDALFRTDLALKSSGGDPRILLERLVVELCGSPFRHPPFAARSCLESVLHSSAA